MRADMTIGFIGNPNSGKTTLFNAYTGAHLKVANWPGVTVEKKGAAASLSSSICRASIRSRRTRWRRSSRGII